MTNRRISEFARKTGAAPSTIIAMVILCVGCATVTQNPGSVSKKNSAAQGAISVSEVMEPFVEEHCSSCHGDKRQNADLNLVDHAHVPVSLDSEPTWEAVIDMLRTGTMPPEKRPRPDQEWIDEVLVALDSALEVVAQNLKPDPGRVTARRLNREEYSNTVRDLLGVEYDATKTFPVDDSGYGFDTIGDVLTLSPLLMEKFFAAAETIADEAVPTTASDNEDFIAQYERVFICRHDFGEHNAACARKIMAPLARRAYRRPITRKETDRLVDFVELVEEDEGSFEEGIRLAIEAMLVSPQFLFRIERDRSPKDPDDAHALNDHELATRISYFLWSTMPDEELSEQADVGLLHEPTILSEQIERMLRDDKADALVENFAGQWLELRNLPFAYRDRNVFPDFGNDLKRAMGEETRLFFASIMNEDRSVLEFLDSDYTFLNEALAEHYGIEGVKGEEFRRVTVDPAQRGGLISQGSLLTLTAYTTRTSPVLRGKWILESLLGAPPPPPPPDVPPLPRQGGGGKLTMRERMEQHRADAACASCHARMDPIGFGLENYDAIGRWRTTEGDVPIDTSGILPSGETFNGPQELKKILMDQKDDFINTLTEKMLTYALGRGLERYDRPVVEGIAQAVAEDDYRFSRLIVEIVESLPFQMRRGDDKEAV